MASRRGEVALRYADDIVAGSTVDLGSWTVSREEILAFGRVWDPQRSHTDEAWAEQSANGGLIASGVHTLAIAQRLMVDAVWSTFVSSLGRSISAVRMRRPVRPGDTVTGTLQFLDLKSRGGTRAMAVFHTSLHNQHGELVFEVDGESVIPLRPNAPAS